MDQDVLDLESLKQSASDVTVEKQRENLATLEMQLAAAGGDSVTNNDGEQGIENQPTEIDTNIKSTSIDDIHSDDISSSTNSNLNLNNRTQGNQPKVSYSNIN